MPRGVPKRGVTSASGARFASQVVRDNLRAYRLLRGLKQDELAERMRMLGHPWSASIAGYVEQGKRALTVDELVAVAVVVGVTVADLLDATNQAGGQGDGALDLGSGDSPFVLSREWARFWVRDKAAVRLMWREDGPASLAVEPRSPEAWERWRGDAEAYQTRTRDERTDQ